MDDETRERAALPLCDPMEAPRKAPLPRKMSGMADSLTAIRGKLAARQELTLETKTLPAVPVNTVSMQTAAETRVPIEKLKLPLLKHIENSRESHVLPRDPFLQTDNVRQRAIQQEIYMTETTSVERAQRAAMETMTQAQRLGEEARQKMLAYSQHESSWKFEERTRRYQQVLEVKQRAESARQEAKTQSEAAKRMKKMLRDPYRELRLEPMIGEGTAPLGSLYLRRQEFVWTWILALPATKLGFTPREESVMIDEKELSMYVVYYIAGSRVNELNVSEEKWLEALEKDTPPTTGWICSSRHGIPPVPLLTLGVEVWTVKGAGAGHLNGTFVQSGVQDCVRKFTSPAGVELFRKRLPAVSSIAGELYDGETARPESSSSSIENEVLHGEDMVDNHHLPKKNGSSLKLPSTIAAIENNEHDFRSMQRLGTWMNTSQSTDKHRRMFATRSTNDTPPLNPSSAEALSHDGDNVTNQSSRETDDTSDVTQSRPEVNAPLCREWVLFARCSRCRPNSRRPSAAEPPPKGIGLGCLKRHYYISHEEKAEMTIWAQTKESWLEKNVLTIIVEREAQLDRVHHLCRKAMVRFQQNLQKDTEKTMAKIFAELYRVRFLTVKCFEAIHCWRQHARKVGFARYEKHANGPENHLSEGKQADTQTEAPLLGWSSSITLETGKQLYKGSKAFTSKIKRFRRSGDVIGKKEQHIVYLGYFETQEEAERAYDEYAASEARRLNTTAEHLPSRRNVFRSCGKHFAVESEKAGPSFCIECKTKQLASLSAAAVDEWVPPFFYGGGNYILKMATDLDFLDDVLPLKLALNDGRGSDEETFPMCGNTFLLPRTPIQDPDLAVFTTFPSAVAPRLGEPRDSAQYNNVDDETVGRDRIFKAQQILLQELQIYRPELLVGNADSLGRILVAGNSEFDISSPQYRLVEALYWDHCAALKVLQQRPPLALRQPNIWCRPDEGEWSSLVVRGAHQLHFLFEQKLEKAGKEMAQRRQQVLLALRQLNKVPLYFVPSRSKFTELIAAGQDVRGDVVQLEVNNTAKRLQRYDSWCAMSLAIQRWFRGVLGRRKARLTRKALRFAYKLRILYTQQVAVTAKMFYEKEVRSIAIRRATKMITKPVYTRAVSMDGELVIVTFHSLRHYHTFNVDNSLSNRLLLPSLCCGSCARRFHIKVGYECHTKRFKIFHGVCTCSFNGGTTQRKAEASEGWLVRGYSSQHNTVYRVRLETAQLLQLISSQQHSQQDQHLSKRNGHHLIEDTAVNQLAAANAARHATYVFKQAENAAKVLSHWRRMRNEATQTRKSLMVSLDTNLVLLDTIKRAHGISILNATKALDFTSRPFSEAQAWDPLENANNWKHIVEKRHLGKSSEEVLLEVERLRIACFQATYNEQFAEAGASQAQDEYNRLWLPLVDRECQSIESATVLETKTRIRMESCMNQLCERFLALRDGFLVSTRRRLVIQDPIWRNMTPVHIAIPGLRRRLNHVLRRTLTLSNRADKGKKTRKMIVTVSMWPLVKRSSYESHGKRDMWITAYDPVDCSVHEIFLEWGLIELLTGSKGRAICQDPGGSKRSAWRAIADILLSLVMLDRFTGAFTLEKLQFYHTLRSLMPQFLSSRVMRDLEAGRKCGQGDEILRQGMCVDGRLCVVVVYENWGDLTFAVYHTRNGGSYRLIVRLSEVFGILSKKPLMLRLWIYCVKSNSYSPNLLVYVMKHARFSQHADGHEVLQLDNHMPARKHQKRFQTALRIQNRRVLVSIVEDSGGDWNVLAYDINSGLRYNLLLEQECLRRMLKPRIAPSGASCVGQHKITSPMTSTSLLLRKNRTLLYSWICDRLRFQSMLEHPELLASSVSSLASSLHMRESFHILNTWIASSSRNPLQAVSQSEIDRRAYEIDVLAFSSLQFDQLAIITGDKLLFALEKEYVGSIDWTDAVAKSLPCNDETWRKQLPYMRIDFFVKSHNLFGRLRGELELEAQQRRKRETWAGMTQEDRNALCMDISALMNTANEQTLQIWQKLTGIKDAMTTHLDQRQLVLAGVRALAKHTEASRSEESMSLNAMHSIEISREGNGKSFLEYLEDLIPSSSMDLDFNQLTLALTSPQSYNPLADGVMAITRCMDRFAREIKIPLSALEATFAKLSHDESCVEQLRLHRRRVNRFCSNLARRSQVITENVDHEQARVTEVCSATLSVEKSITDQQTAARMGALIPCNICQPIEEVFLSELPRWAPTQSNACPYMTHEQELLTEVRPFFQQLWMQQSQFQQTPKTLLCQRVSYGVLVFETLRPSSKQNQHWNSRASALCGGMDVRGPALFYPFDCRESSNWYRQIVHCDALFMKFAAGSKKAEDDATFSKRLPAVRPAKQLPWKDFAIQRLRVSHAVKCSRVSEGSFVGVLNQDVTELEKETRAVSFICVESRQLEVLLGKPSSYAFVGNEDIVHDMKAKFALTRIPCGDRTGNTSTVLQVSFNNPRVLHNVLHNVDPDGNDVLVPCIGCEGENEFKMNAVQVEIDDIDKPRRLIFSYRERRNYFIDCDYHEVQSLLLRRSHLQRVDNRNASASTTLGAKWTHRAIALSIREWRNLAEVASQFLVFRKKNGTLSLSLDVCLPDPLQQGSAIATGGDSVMLNSTEQNSRQLLDGVVKFTSKPHRSRAGKLEDQQTVSQLLARRFEKNQAAIRVAASDRVLAGTSASASEWVNMTQEDWRSQELRGILVLDGKVLEKLDSIYAAATQQARKYLTAGDDSGILVQLKEIGKAMGEKDTPPVEVESLHRIRAVRWRRRGKDATKAAKGEEAKFADVAEWWRRYLIRKQESKVVE